MRRFLPLLALLLVLSCAKTGSLAGTWDIGGAEITWPGSTANMTFTPGDDPNKGSVISVLEGPQSINGVDLVQTFRCKGTYDLSGSELKVTYTDVEASMKGLDAEAEKRFQKAMADQKATLLTQMNAEGPGKVKWIDKDTFEFEPK